MVTDTLSIIHSNNKIIKKIDRNTDRGQHLYTDTQNDVLFALHRQSNSNPVPFIKIYFKSLKKTKTRKRSKNMNQSLNHCISRPHGLILYLEVFSKLNSKSISLESLKRSKFPKWLMFRYFVIVKVIIIFDTIRTSA